MGGWRGWGGVGGWRAMGVGGGGQEGGGGAWEGVYVRGHVGCACVHLNSLHAHVRACVRACVRVCVRACVCVCARARVCVYMFVYYASFPYQQT